MASGKNGVRPVETASWKRQEGSVRSPGVQNRLLNGPCGGASKGKCEIKRETECAWQLIYDRLKALGQLHRLEEIIPAKRWGRNRETAGLEES